MIYNHRCKIVKNITTEGYLGEEVISKEVKTVPCSIHNISFDEQIAFFGKYNKNALKVHLQGYFFFDEINIDGISKNIFDVKFHRNSTVVILT